MALPMILLLVPIFLIPIILHVQRYKTIKSIALPPGPRGLPFIGNLHQFDYSNPQNYFWRLSKQYGPMVSLRLGSVPILVVSSAKMAEEVLKTHDLQFCGRPALVSQQKVSYNGLDVAFAPYNAYWREIRKICVVHLFNSNRVQSFRPIREDYFPSMGWVDNITGMIRRLERTFKEFDAFHQELIEEHMDPARIKTEQEDIVDVLLQLWKQGGSKVDLTWDHIKAVLMDVLIAGTDTSAATLIWALTYLMKNCRVMKKVQEEIRSLIRNKDFVDEDDVEKLSYLRAVVKETLRMQPVAPLLIPRETTEKCKIDRYEIPQKTRVFVNAWAIGRDPETWENPNEFYPERFIDSPIDFKGQHFELIPFGAGRRICPGIQMGIATVDLALANLLYKFDWEMPFGMHNDDLDFDALPGLAVHKKNPLCLVPRYHYHE
ncbi:cytochrome P450 71B36-like isoform X2 [Citrus sinensis]|uniref:cytochrome P450 71B36-like isoform X2 n=1 Tax=Citrus sinensis TaxID=2711 RepID=UPI0022774870|nr:cytochrome P450 71B36-like isoform X2 [Citrus sinensis]